MEPAAAGRGAPQAGRAAARGRGQPARGRAVGRGGRSNTGAAGRANGAAAAAGRGGRGTGRGSAARGGGGRGAGRAGGRGGRAAGRGGAGRQGGRGSAQPPSIEDLEGDRLMAVANHYWARGGAGAAPGTYSAALITKIYKDQLRSASPAPPRAAAQKGKAKGDAATPATAAGADGGKDTKDRLQLLEVTCYLENYLWPYFKRARSSVEHLLSIVLLANEKFSTGVSFWESIGVEGTDSAAAGIAKFSTFFACCQDLVSGSWPHGGLKQPLSYYERTAFTVFLINVFQSLEQPAVRAAALKLCSLPLWAALSPARLAVELKAYPQLRRHWQHLQAARSSSSSAEGTAAPAGATADSNGDNADDDAEQGDEPPRKKQRQADGSTTAGGSSSSAAAADAADGGSSSSAAAADAADEGADDMDDDDSSTAAAAADADTAAAATAAAAAAARAVKATAAAAAALRRAEQHERTFLPTLVQQFLSAAENCPQEGSEQQPEPGLLRYLERFLELLIDLLCQLPTRRFLRAVLLDMKVRSCCCTRHCYC
jgi:Intron-binding protein aquarius N-terminus